MKKTMLSLFLIVVPIALLLPSTITNEVKDDLEDKPVLVEAHSSRNIVTISVQNYRGGAWVEIIGSKGAKQYYFEVYDMGFDVVSLSGLPADKYTIRIMLGTETFTGTFKKGMYGNN